MASLDGRAERCYRDVEKSALPRSNGQQGPAEFVQPFAANDERLLTAKINDFFHQVRLK